MKLPLRKLILLPILAASLKAEVPIACAPAAPAGKVGDAVSLSVWTDPAPTNPRWTVNTGKVETRDGNAVWNLEGAESGPAVAEVTVDVVGETATCQVQLLVVDSLDTESRSGRERYSLPLAPNTEETPGLGQYSYLLFGSKPEGAPNEARYKSMIEAVLSKAPYLTALTENLERFRINGLYLPVTEAPSAAPDAAWVLVHYDYAAASRLISRAPNPPVRSVTGVYLIAAKAPLKTEPTKDVFVQDLTNVPAELASTWVDAFINQAAQQDFSRPDAAQQFTLKVRLALYSLSIGVPKVKEAVAAWVSLKR